MGFILNLLHEYFRSIKKMKISIKGLFCQTSTGEI